MSKYKTQYPVLTVPKDAQFFVSISRLKVHNYLMAGYFETDETGKQIPHLLLAVGKNGLCSERRRGRFYPQIVNEGIIRKAGNYFEYNKREIDYKAYAISYEQYLQLVNHIKAIRRDNDTGFKPHYYYPVEEDDNTRTFIYSRGQKFNAAEVADVEVTHNHHQLNFVTNDCRTSAKAILEAVDVVDPKLSRHWYGKLPNKLQPQTPELIIHRHATDADMKSILDYVDQIMTSKISSLNKANNKHHTRVKQNKIDALTALKNEMENADDKLDTLRTFRQDARHFKADHSYLEFGFFSGFTRGIEFPHSAHKTRKLFTCTTSLMLDEIEDVLSGGYRVVDASYPTLPSSLTFSLSGAKRK